MSESTKKGRKHHTLEQVIAKLREASAMLASGQRGDVSPLEGSVRGDA